MPTVTKMPYKNPKSTQKGQEELQRFHRKILEEMETDDSEDEYENYFETDFHKKMVKELTPALYVSHLRDATGMSQVRLAQEIGGVTPRRISDWENGRRNIDKRSARRLSKIFGLPAERFI